MQKTIALFAVQNNFIQQYMKIYILKRGENNYKKHYQLGGW